AMRANWRSIRLSSTGTGSCASVVSGVADGVCSGMSQRKYRDSGKARVGRCFQPGNIAFSARDQFACVALEVSVHLIRPRSRRRCPADHVGGVIFGDESERCRCARPSRLLARHALLPYIQTMLAKLTTKNQLTLPKRALDALGTPATPEYFEVEVADGRIVLTPTRIGSADAVRRKLAELGITDA